MNTIIDQCVKTNTPTFIFVDGSYYCFYRYYALINWWKNTFPDEAIEDPYKNQIFLEKFKKLFVENLLQIPKKLCIEKETEPIMIVGKDCKRENIWRMNLFPQYKGNRVQDDFFMGKPFFKMVYEDRLFEKGGIQNVLYHPNLEADDCIAISVKYLLNRYPECKIYIITSDKDYLQLARENVYLFNLAYKNIAINSLKGPDFDLQMKIIMGDNSDNIPSIFPKCGPKTAQKCIENMDFFNNKMCDNPIFYSQYELNKKLIDFINIPLNLVNEFMDSIKI